MSFSSRAHTSLPLYEMQAGRVNYSISNIWSTWDLLLWAGNLWAETSWKLKSCYYLSLLTDQSQKNSCLFDSETSLFEQSCVLLRSIALFCVCTICLLLLDRWRGLSPAPYSTFSSYGAKQRKTDLSCYKPAFKKGREKGKEKGKKKRSFMAVHGDGTKFGDWVIWSACDSA